LEGILFKALEALGSRAQLLCSDTESALLRSLRGKMEVVVGMEGRGKRGSLPPAKSFLFFSPS
jgi:hypothetical protein